MPRPSKEWEKKYGKKAPVKKTVLTGSDDVYSASEKLAGKAEEAQAIVLMMMRQANGSEVIRLLDMDDMQLRGQRIVRAYHEWSKNDYGKLLKGIEDRDSNLIAFINKIEE